MTSFFAKKAVDYAALINNHWSQYHRIEQFKKKIPYYEIGYRNFTIPFNVNSVSINKAMEHNLSTNFTILKQHGVTVKPFSKSVKLDSKNQAQDDIIFDFSHVKENIVERRVVGFDQKASTVGSITDPSSKIFSNMTVDDYQKIITSFQQLLFNNVFLSADHQFKIRIGLQQLIDSCEDLETHQLIWAEILYLFPNQYLPPIRVPKNCSIHNFDQKTMEQYLVAEKKL
jgi:hypothetical protein